MNALSFPSSVKQTQGFDDESLLRESVMGANVGSNSTINVLYEGL